MSSYNYKLHQTKYFDKQKKRGGVVLPESCRNSIRILPEFYTSAIFFSGGGGGHSVHLPPVSYAYMPLIRDYDKDVKICTSGGDCKLITDFRTHFSVGTTVLFQLLPLPVHAVDNLSCSAVLGAFKHRMQKWVHCTNTDVDTLQSLIKKSNRKSNGLHMQYFQFP